MPSSAVTFNTK